LPKDESPWSSLLFAGVFGAVISSGLMLFYGEAPPTAQALFLLLVIGPVGGLAQLLLILALQNAPASVLAPFGYVGLAYATVWGLVLFGEIPDAPTVLGASIIVGSGLFVWMRERQSARRHG
ncbi:MAG: EamA family transporter, partial [Pseudomonadota bacterium]